MLQHARSIVVTGGAGFIGTHLVEHLLAATSARIVILDNLRRRGAGPADISTDRRVRLVTGDVRDADVVDAVIGATDLVYHLAAVPSSKADDIPIDEIFSTNAVGTFNVLKAAARSGTARVVFASCQHAYGEPIALPVEEGHPLLSIDICGATKVIGETLCRAFRHDHDVQTVILRISDVYGPGDSAGAVSTWLRQLRTGQNVEVFGGSRIVDFVWVGQVVKALAAAASVSGSAPINVASGSGLRLRDVARRVAQLAGSRMPLLELPARGRGARRFIANVDRMRHLLELEPPLDPLAFLPALFDTQPAAVS
jgi:UDP-glucose 4-epimerase